MPVLLDVELSRVTITRRREAVVIPDTCPNIDCGKPLTGPDAVDLLFRGVATCIEQTASLDETEELLFDDATDDVGRTLDTCICCYACGGLLFGSAVSVTPPVEDEVPPPETAAALS
jgi:hypothetical protein